MAPKVVMKVWGRTNGSWIPERDTYLKSYDPEAFDGIGHAEFTADIKDALVMQDTAEFFRIWSAIPQNRPTRADGSPNKPLTAYDVEVVWIER